MPVRYSHIRAFIGAALLVSAQNVDADSVPDGRRNRPMSFTSWPLAFAVDITNAVNAVRQTLQPSECTPVLYHSTSFRGITGIIDTHALWATCVEDLEDKAEIQHGTDMIEAEIQKAGFKEANAIPEQILRFVPQFLTERRSWTFVACFRGTLEPPNLAEPAAAKRCAEWVGGHPYCLEFETLSDWEPRLRLGMHAELQYYRVVYDPALQRDAIARAITAVMDSAQKYCGGTLEGPWAESSAKSHARIAAQCLIDMISGFKSAGYGWEDEWRIVCRPRIMPAGSAPDLEDDNFGPYIKTGNSRYVELRVYEQGPVFSAFPPCVLPFRAVQVSDPSNSLFVERKRIRRMLDENRRLDIPIRVSAG